MVTVNNGQISVKISTKGAEIRSIKRGETEYMWSPDPKFLDLTAPILFPICGGLKDGRYELFGKSYEMPKHGFASLCTFEVKKKTESSVTMILRDSEMTRKMYPYSFAFRVSFEAIGNSLRVTYDAENLDSKVMYCTFGTHETYACPGGMENYEIVFPERETLYAYGLNGNIVTDYTKLIVDDSNTLVLRDSYFLLNGLVFRNLKSRSAEIVSKTDGRRVKIDFDGFNNLILWNKPGGSFICFEPWCGLPDVVGSSFDISEKEGMFAVAPGEHLIRMHTITV